MSLSIAWTELLTAASNLLIPNKGISYSMVAPTDPGLYVVMLQYKDSKASQIVNVEPKFEYEYSASDWIWLYLHVNSKTKFIVNEFGGDSFAENPRFASVIMKSNLRLPTKMPNKWMTILMNLSYLWRGIFL